MCTDRKGVVLDHWWQSDVKRTKIVACSIKIHKLLSVNIYQIYNCKLVSCYCLDCHVLAFMSGFNALIMTCVTYQEVAQSFKREMTKQSICLCKIIVHCVVSRIWFPLICLLRGAISFKCLSSNRTSKRGLASVESSLCL